MTDNENKPRTTVVADINFEVTDIVSAARRVVDLAKAKSPVPLRFVNAYSVATASRNPSYLAILNGAGLNFPDGSPVAWIAKRTSELPASQVRGPSLFRQVFALPEGRALGHFLLGSSQETIDSLITRLIDDYPGTTISGSYSPPFGPLTESSIHEMAAQIAETKADMVWVALGTPKQDFAAAKLAPLVGRPCAGVGAAFDFVAGTVAEAPIWVQRFGMEWAFRLVSQPRRLWRRYLVHNISFIYAVRRDLIRAL